MWKFVFYVLRAVLIAVPLANLGVFFGLGREALGELWLITSIITGSLTFFLTVYLIWDIRKLMQRNRMLQHDNLHDFLTGLPNRKHFYERFEAVLMGQRQPFALIAVDLDRFKRVNDTWGHATGDVVLQEVARRLKAKAPGEAVVSRFGGEEFMVLLPDADLAEAARVAEVLRHVIAGTPVETQTAQVSITASFGVTTGMAGEHADETLHRADTALYVAKDTGRNRVVHDETPREADEMRADLRIVH